MKIHVYMIFYNEEVILPYFLRHYGAFAEKIVCFDNRSTDRSAAIVDAHPKTERIVFDTGEGMFDRIHLDLKSEYRKSRGKADWVICVDCDEFIYHPDIVGLLTKYKKEGITYPKVQGFEMVSEHTPVGNKQIFEEVRNGFPNEGYAKRILFAPELEIQFAPGCHTANVSGCVVESPQADLKLLHYRFLGRDFFINRSIERRARLSEENKKCGWGTHYLNPDAYFLNLFNEVSAISKPVVTELPVQRS
jgi:glycosyltransferase involved in cell wall biosynthesis